jgi:sugar-phosphatase
MDGLLVDSEPWWRVAERNVFGNLSMEPTEEDFDRMMGNRIQEVIANWYARHPWEDYDALKTQHDIVDEVRRLVTTHAQLMPGVKESLDYFRSKNLPIALASSSPLRLIDAIVSHYDIRNYFSVIRSAENEKQGKPHPAVFLATAKELNVHPEHCLVFEDSYNGVLAAKAAGMKCIAVPSPEHHPQERFGIADWKWKSLDEVHTFDSAAFSL